MKEHKQALRTAIVVAAVVLIAVLALVVLFFGGSKQPEQTITLPETPVTQTDDPPVQAPEENLFAEITRENVQAVLGSLSRPSSYHQVLTVVTYAGGQSRQQQVDLWRSGELLRADLSDQYGVKSIVTDGKTLYVWYDDDQTPLQLPAREAVDVQALLGIPTYETVLAQDPAQISDAEFVTLPDQAQLACIFLSVTDEGITQNYWVDVASGLLCRQTMLQEGKTVYILQQSQLEILIDGDETLDNAFCLPDGTEPFA